MRALAILIITCYSIGGGGEQHVRAATRESLLETQAAARPRRRAPELVGRPIGAQMRGMEVYVEPAVARAECGSGVRLVNNAAAFASTFWRSSLRAFTCQGRAWQTPPSRLGMEQLGERRGRGWVEARVGPATDNKKKKNKHTIK